MITYPLDNISEILVLFTKIIWEGKMIFLYYLCYFIAGGLLVNGLFHYLMGMFGRKFIKKPRALSNSRFDNMKTGKSHFNSAVYNVVYGLIHFFVVLFILLCVGSFHFGLNWETGIFLLNIILSSILVAWNFEGTLS